MKELEAKIREAISDITKPGDIQHETVDKIMNAICDELSLWTMQQKMRAETQASCASSMKRHEEFYFYRGRILAFGECWSKVTFDGIEADVEQIEEAQNYWKDRVRSIK